MDNHAHTEGSSSIKDVTSDLIPTCKISQKQHQWVTSGHEVQLWYSLQANILIIEYLCEHHRHYIAIYQCYVTLTVFWESQTFIFKHVYLEKSSITFMQSLTVLAKSVSLCGDVYFGVTNQERLQKVGNFISSYLNPCRVITRPINN